MKNSLSALKNRGYIEPDTELRFLELSFEQKVDLLQSVVPTQRSVGARLLADEYNTETVHLLIDALKKEKKLYPKIEICNALVKQGKPAVKPLISVLGEIGKNQHTEVPQMPFNKKSYPLPRDIAARTLSRIGVAALPDLCDMLNVQNNNQRLSETIDAIGYICFYATTYGVHEKLISYYFENKNNELVCWKIIRAMSGFPESKDFLMEQLETKISCGIKKEIKRSLSLINSCP